MTSTTARYFSDRMDCSLKTMLSKPFYHENNAVHSFEAAYSKDYSTFQGNHCICLAVECGLRKYDKCIEHSRV